MKLNFDNVEKMPDSMLKDVTERPPESEQSPQSSPLSSLSEEDVLKEGAHANVTPLDSVSGGSFNNTSGPTTTKVNVGGMFDGGYAVNMLDALLPSLMVVLLKYMKITVRKSEMQLTESEKKTLSPIVTDCLKTLNLDFNNPWVALACTAGIIYGSKIIEKAGVASLDKIAEKKTHEKIKKAAQAASTAKKDTPLAGSVVTEQPANNPQPVQQTTNEGAKNVSTPTFTEKQIEAEMRRLRRGKERAIESLTNNWKRQQKRQLAK